MDKSKYICVDTQIWIYCCLSSQKGEDKKLLQTMKSRLDSDAFSLILPETVNIEFQRKVKIEIENFRTQIGKQAKEFSMSVYPVYEGRIKKHINNIQEEVETDYENAKKIVEEIFHHRNTIHTKITPEVMVNAHKRGMKGLKPYTYSQDNKTILASGIQSDCLIIEELKSFLKDKPKYELFFCSNNKNDFSDGKDNSVIHPDIKKDFSNIQLFTKLSELLNNLFDAGINESKLPPNIFRDTVSGMQNINGPSTFSVTQSLTKPLMTASEAIAGTVTNLNSAINSMGSLPSLNIALSDAVKAFDTINQIIPKFTCSKCGKEQSGYPNPNNTCMPCFLIPFETAGTKP